MDIKELKARRNEEKQTERIDKLADSVLALCCTGEYSANEVIAALIKVKDVLHDIPLIK